MVQNGPLQVSRDCLCNPCSAVVLAHQTYTFVHSEIQSFLWLLTSSCCTVLPGQQCFVYTQLLQSCNGGHDLGGSWCLHGTFQQDAQDVSWRHLCPCYQNHGTDHGIRGRGVKSNGKLGPALSCSVKSTAMLHRKFHSRIHGQGSKLVNLPECLQEDPASHEPVSLLGFDPVLSMPSLEDLSKSIKQQKRSLKALLLDQVRNVCGLLRHKVFAAPSEPSTHCLWCSFDKNMACQHCLLVQTASCIWQDTA